MRKSSLGLLLSLIIRGALSCVEGFSRVSWRSLATSLTYDKRSAVEVARSYRRLSPAAVPSFRDVNLCEKLLDKNKIAEYIEG